MSHPVVLLLARGDARAPQVRTNENVSLAGDPFAAGRETACIDEQGIAAGTVQVDGSWSLGGYPFTEMLVLHRGSVTLHCADQRLQLQPGQSVVIGRGTRLQIDTVGESLWAFCLSTKADGPNAPGLTLIDPRTVLMPSAAPPANMLISATPQCRSNTLFEDSSSVLRVGVWDSTPYARLPRPHPVHELMHVLEGEVELRQEGEPALIVRRGDSVFVPQGVPCAWTSTVFVRKYYAVT